MQLKSVVDGLLKEKNRSLSWLADEMGKTFDGLKLSLVKGSIKYNDLIAMGNKLEVSPAVFFQPAANTYDSKDSPLTLADPKEEYGDLKNNLKNCREMVNALKGQLKDKEMIITLLNSKNN